MLMSVPETQTTASKCVLTPTGVTDVLATLDTHSIVTEELAEVIIGLLFVFLGSGCLTLSTLFYYR